MVKAGGGLYIHTSFLHIKHHWQLRGTWCGKETWLYAILNCEPCEYLKKIEFDTYLHLVIPSYVLAVVQTELGLGSPLVLWSKSPCTVFILAFPQNQWPSAKQLSCISNYLTQNFCLKFLFIVLLLYMCECFVCISVCIAQMSGDPRDQQRVSDPVGLELQMIVNGHLGAGNSTQVLCKATSVLNHWANSPAKANLLRSISPWLFSLSPSLKKTIKELDWRKEVRDRKTVLTWSRSRERREQAGAWKAEGSLSPCTAVVWTANGKATCQVSVREVRL